MESVSVDTDCNMRGQNSRSVVGMKIQTNIKATLPRDRYYHLGCVHCLF